MAGVIPFPRLVRDEPPPTPPTENDDGPPCVVCGARGLNDDWHCDRCEATMHEACLWGRIASLDEWRRYVQFVYSDRDKLDHDILCPTCRLAVELGD